MLCLQFRIHEAVLKFSLENLLLIGWEVRSAKYRISFADDCPGINDCGTASYRGTDCHCYCKNDHINNEIPAIKCEEGTFYMHAAYF